MKLVVIVVHFEQAPSMYIRVPWEWRTHLVVFRHDLSVRHWW